MSNEPGLSVARLIEKRHAGKNCYTLLFDSNISAKPGQFVMIWIPDIDEIPMSVSHIRRGSIGVTVKIVGEATDAFCAMKKGERVRIRGSFGRGFSYRGKKHLIVAGGVGSAPLLPLAEELIHAGGKVITIVGAKSKDELVLLDEFKALGADTLISTDDGSFGFHGFASQLLKKKIEEGLNVDSIYCCGPEPMIKAVKEIADKRKILGQAALERLMKCGVGICGSCAINEKLVCKNGPVFDFVELSHLSEFGRTKRDAAGRARSIVK